MSLTNPADPLDALDDIFGEGHLPPTPTSPKAAPKRSAFPAGGQPVPAATQTPSKEEKQALAWFASVGGERYDTAAMAATQPAPIDWVFPGIKTGIVKSLISTGGVGKSYLSLGLAATIATGDDILGLSSAWGRMIKQGRVVFLALEDDKETVHNRIYDIAIEERHPGEFAKKLSALQILGIPGGINIADAECECAVTHFCLGARLVIVDTLRMIHDGEENSSGDMKRVMATLTRIAKETNAAVLFLHHTNKLAAVTGEGDQQHASRGSSVITDNTRGSFFLQTMTKEEAATLGIPEQGRHKHIRFGMGKENLGARWDDIWLKRDHKGIPRVADIRTVWAAAAPAKPAMASKSVASYKGVEIKL